MLKLIWLILIIISSYGDTALLPDISEDKINYRVTEAYDKLVYSNRINIYKDNNYNISLIIWNIVPYSNNNFEKPSQRLQLYFGYKY